MEALSFGALSKVYTAIYTYIDCVQFLGYCLGDPLYFWYV